MSEARLGRFALNQVTEGDSRRLVEELPDESIDVVVTSPPYWGQRLSVGNGIEEDPREYLAKLQEFFAALKPKMKSTGIVWINIGDAYNTPVNWRATDHTYSSLGSEGRGLPAHNSAYVKPRHKRRAFIDRREPWLQYGNLLALPYRLVTGMSDDGWLFRGEVVWRKRNPMPEGRTRRPHRQHEPIYLFAKTERHKFRVKPPVGTVWDIANEKIPGLPHYSRFPEELPRRCLDAYVVSGAGVIALYPVSGSGRTVMEAPRAGGS